MDAADEHNDNFDLYPDVPTRELAASIEPDTVVAMKFHGIDIMHEKDPIILDDAPLIAEFLEALRNAEGRPVRVGNTLDIMEIHVKSPDGQVLAASLRFFPFLDVDCYGPRFRQCLVKLGRFQADRKRAVLQRVEPHVTRVELPLWCIEDQTQARQFVRTLGPALPFCYALTDPAQIPCPLAIHQTGGDPILLDLLISNDFDQAGIDLPATLIEYIGVSSNCRIGG